MMGLFVLCLIKAKMFSLAPPLRALIYEHVPLTHLLLNQSDPVAQQELHRRPCDISYHCQNGLRASYSPTIFSKYPYPRTDAIRSLFESLVRAHKELDRPDLIGAAFFKQKIGSLFFINQDRELVLVQVPFNGQITKNTLFSNVDQAAWAGVDMVILDNDNILYLGHNWMYDKPLWVKLGIDLPRGTKDLKLALLNGILHLAVLDKENRFCLYSLSNGKLVLRRRSDSILMLVATEYDLGYVDTLGQLVSCTKNVTISNNLGLPLLPYRGSYFYFQVLYQDTEGEGDLVAVHPQEMLHKLKNQTYQYFKFDEVANEDWADCLLNKNQESDDE